MKRQQGTLADWNDERGFGFITPSAGGPRVFVHVSAFPRGRRPAVDDLLTYDVGRDERERLYAAKARHRASTRLWRLGTGGLAPALATASLFFALLVALVALGQLPALLLAPYDVLSALAFLMYRADKTAAEQGAWRVPEANLHVVALLGGWPGALVARRVLRHKTRKQPFKTIFWGTVLANCAALAWLVHDGMPFGLG